MLRPEVRDVDAQLLAARAARRDRMRPQARAASLGGVQEALARRAVIRREVVGGVGAHGAVALAHRRRPAYFVDGVVFSGVRRWFSEGTDTLDLRNARASLAQLH